MMTHTKRIMALLLAALLLSAGLSACGEAAETTDTAAAEDTAADTAPAETEEPRLDSGLPEKDLGGYTVTFYGDGCEGIYVEEMTGDIVNDAVYNRNAALSEKYNFEIKQITAEDYAIAGASQTILAGDDAYQVLTDGPFSFGEFITANLLWDMNTMPYQDFSQPWWYASVNDGISIANHLYMSCSAFMLDCFRLVYHPIVNADLALDLGVDIHDLYEEARNGTWTLDQFIELIKLGGTDLNGDGVMDYQDQWGLQTEAYCGYSLALGCGFRLAQKDENDIPYISAGTEEAINIWDKLTSQIYSDKNMFLATQEITGVESVWSTAVDMFSEGRTLVFKSTLSSYMRELDFNFGILPNPKFDENQESYYHTGTSWNSPLLGVPVSVQDIDSVSFALEAMAYESYYEVLPTFYENYLQTKLLRDEESVEMLEMIHSTVTFDCGAVYNWGALLDQTYKIVRSGTNNLATVMASKKTSAETALQTMLDNIGE